MPLRADIWSSAVDIFSGHPILGVGLGNFSVAYASAVDACERVAATPAQPARPDCSPERAEPLSRRARRGGIVGLAALTLLGLLAARVVWLGLHVSDPAGRAVALGLGASLITLAIHDVFEGMLLTELVWPLFALVAVVAGFVALARPQTPAETRAKPARNRRSNARRAPEGALQDVRVRAERHRKNSVKGQGIAAATWATMTLPARKEGRSCSNASPNGPGKSSF